MAASWLQRRRDEADEVIISAFQRAHFFRIQPTWLHSADLKALTGMRWARVLRALRRLQESGAVEDRWDDTDPKHPRRMYRLAIHERAKP